MTIEVETAALAPENAAGSALGGALGGAVDQAIGSGAPSPLPPPAADRDAPAMPAIALAQVAFLNAFYRRRPAAAFSLTGRPARIAASWPPAADAADGRIDIAVDGAAGAVTLSRPLIEAIIAAAAPDQRLDHLEPPHLALLLELALNDELTALEADLGVKLAIAAVHLTGDGALHPRAIPLAFTLAVEGAGTSGGELLLQPGHAALLAQLLDRHAPPPGLLQPAEQTPAAIDVPFVVTVCVAASTCTVGEMAALAPGDVVMSDHACRAGAAVAVIAGHLVAPVELTATGARVTAQPARGHGSLWEWSMKNGKEGSQADVLQSTGLDDIPVRLLFELGRVEMSLAEIRQLAAGAVIPMSRPAEEGVDIIANGRRVGRGNLVQIGDSLGVRIARLFDNG